MPLPAGSRGSLPAGGTPGRTGPEEVPVQVDLLRADLYRLLDELVRARSERHQGLVAEFERTWEQFKDATTRDG